MYKAYDPETDGEVGFDGYCCVTPPSAWTTWWWARRAARVLGRRTSAKVELRLMRPLSEDEAYRSIHVMFKNDYEGVVAVLVPALERRGLSLDYIVMQRVDTIRPNDNQQFDIVKATATVSRAARR